MKTITLSTKFYIVFSLVFSVPASQLALILKNYMDSLPSTNFFYYLSSIGILGAPTTVLILLILFWFLNNYLWKLWPIRKLFKIPNISGRYEGDLTSFHTENQEQNGTYKVAAEIKQTLTSIKVFLYTQTSCSHSLIANICKNNNENYELVYIYQNRTSAIEADHDMRDHEGMASIEIFDDGDTLIGKYFNNPRERGRFGKINLKKTSYKIEGKL